MAKILGVHSLPTAGLQDFVDTTTNLLTATTTTGSPAAGFFYSSINNRAQISDISKNLKAHLGIERVMLQTLYQLNAETGPNNEIVWGLSGDTLGLVRCIGYGWSPMQYTLGGASGVGQTGFDSYGAKIGPSGTSDNESIEITFYGTGLNGLTIFDNNNRNWNYSVDGGSTQTGSQPTSNSAVLSSKNYAANQIINVVSGLALGVHTVKIINVNNFFLYGYEVLNESSLVKVNPGIAYIQGQKITVASQQSFAYNAPVTGSNGGRVLVYLNSSGIIGTAFTQCATTPLYNNAGPVNHSNEEMYREYHWREFGTSGNVNSDFTEIGTSNTGARGYTLDDGTTGMACQATGGGGVNLGIDWVQWNNANSQGLTFQFVGTGIDFFGYINGSGSGNNFTFVVDGVTAYTFTAGTQGIYSIPLASGLPYGSHTVVLTRVSVSTSNPFLVSFKCYQPKKPSLPSGAIELADYNVMANYVAGTGNTWVQSSNPSKGVLVKGPMREAVYVGANWSQTTDFTSDGVGLFNNGTGQTAQYTFWGTGIEISTNGNSGTAVAVQMDGVNVASAVATGGSFSSPNWTLAAGTGTLQITGFTLGLHTLKLTTNNSTGFEIQSFQIITPTYSPRVIPLGSYQSANSVGSCSLSDNRVTSPVPFQSSQKAFAQAQGIQNSPSSITSNYPTPMQDMAVTVTTTAAYSVLDCMLDSHSANGAGTAFMQLFIDGVPYGVSHQISQAGNYSLSFRQFVPVAKGTHRVEIYWWSSSGSASRNNQDSILTVREL